MLRVNRILDSEKLFFIKLELANFVKKILIKLLSVFILNKQQRKSFRKENLIKSISGFKITPKTKCLIVAPHPDDEVIGCGGLMAKNARNFDVICISSSGVAYQNIGAEERADIRIQEFEKVMQQLGIVTYWIFKIFGVPPMVSKIADNFCKYAKILNLYRYDYIFLPSPIDNHKEHQFVTNELMKNIIIKNGYKKNCKIVFYEVWTPMPNPSYFEDISEVIDFKKKLIGIYESQLVKIDYVSRISALNHYRGVFANNAEYAEAYKVVSMEEYLRGVI